MAVSATCRRNLFRGGPILQARQQSQEPLMDPLPFLLVEPLRDGGIAGHLGQQAVAGGHLRQMHL